MTGVPMLPEPSLARWQPLRAGLVDMFLYDIEEFHFNRGGLLLRGNNGTGKSKVLALTLPFLLDGELAPHRVEPDGDRQKRMEWNLLLGGRYAERLGYTWLEFGRRDDDGTCRYLTIGCGLKAVAGRGIARHWFFVTEQRIGPQLSLLTAGRTALPRDRLIEAVGDHGRVLDRAVDYRRAVDEALFGLGHRYDSLVSLLIQLRAPQLTKRPDERLLSSALTDALAPLDENLVTQVAEAFRNLDDERLSLQTLRDASRAADEFLATYRRYAEVAAKRRAAELRIPHSRYEQLQRDLVQAQRAYEQADAEVGAAQAKRLAAEAERVRLGTRRRSLDDGPEARAARELSRLAEAAARLAALAGREEATYQRLVQQVDAQRRQADVAKQEVHDAEQAHGGAREAAALAAARAEVRIGHADLVRRLDAVDDAALPAALRERSDQLVSWRATTLHDLDRLVHAQAELRRRHSEAQLLLDSAQERVNGAEEQTRLAEQVVVEAGEDLMTAVRRHGGATTELRLPDLDDVLAAVGLWVETMAGDSPVSVAVARAAQAAADALGRAAAGIDAQTVDARARESAVNAELAELTAGRQAVPLVAPTRIPHESAEARPGAPLWRVIDFVDEVGPAERAGFEAALLGAGLLDAWLHPDGRLTEPATGEALIVAGEPVPDNLTTVLRPALDPADPGAAALSPDLVQQVLAAIGADTASGGGTWVDNTGRYGIGVLRGRWTKPAAEFIGDAARQTARRARVAVLTAELAGLHAVLADLGRQATALDGRRGRLAYEVATVPTDGALREAHAAAGAARAGRQQARELLDRAVAESRAVSSAVADAEGRVTAFAADADLPSDPGELAAVRVGLADYRVALAAWWPAWEYWRRAARRLDEEKRRCADQVALLEPADEARVRAREEAAETAEQYATLSETAGADVEELHRQIAETDLRLAAVGIQERQANDAERAAIEARGAAKGQQAQLADDLAEAIVRRDEAVGRLREFIGTGLLTVACPGVDLPDGVAALAPTPAVQLARVIDVALSDVAADDRSWEKRQGSVTTGFKVMDDALTAQDQHAAMTIHDGIITVDVTFASRTLPVAELATTLADEVAQRQRLLSAHEREVLENHLVNEVAAALQERISAAESQVAGMNAELADRPTSTGMRLRLVWGPAADSPPGLSELRSRQLRQSADVWTEADRRRVGEFLQAQIDRQRAGDGAANWAEQLTRALDYRSWHRFTIERHTDGAWRSATGPASGGERVLAASVPLFAAASSYYSSAGNAYAPRLIALDEAFAGVDDDARAKCLGLLAAFDLDVVMTSEREWGCYPQVPGLAISQLARQEGVDAVLVTPWRWDGRRRERLPRPEPHLPAPRPTGPDDQPDRLL